MKTAVGAKRQRFSLKGVFKLVQITTSIREIDFSEMRPGETALVENPGDQWVRLWRRGNNLQVSVPIDGDDLSARELDDIAQGKLGMEEQ